MQQERTWGIIPAAGAGTRIQPLAFSKELLPVGSHTEDGVERPRAVSEYLVERMLIGGATNLCFIVSPGKADIIAYYGDGACPAHLCYTVQSSPSGLCDALFSTVSLLAPDDWVLIGLPDTVWFPLDGYRALPDVPLAFLLFPVDRPELFDVVLTDDAGRVREIQVKPRTPGSRWIWGAVRVRASMLMALHQLWISRRRADEYLGTLVNAWLSQGGEARGVRAGTAYVDVGTLHGYREAIRLLKRPTNQETTRSVWPRGKTDIEAGIPPPP